MSEPSLEFEPMREWGPEQVRRLVNVREAENEDEQYRKLGINRFFLPPEQETAERGPGRLMAAIEVPDTDEEGTPQEPDYVEPTYFEFVDFGWYINGRRGSDSWLDVYQKAPLSVLELTDAPRPMFSQKDEPGDIAWFSYAYEPSNDREANARLYTSLFAAGAPVRITGEPERMSAPSSGPMCASGWVPVNAEAAVAYAAPADFAELIDRLLPDLASTSGVAVYDVGQGACQAIVDRRRHLPLLYVDFGGGVLYNRWTFPRDTAGFCFTQRPPVVLSHWDWDHWSSAALFPEALRAHWLTPPVPGTPIQQSLAAALYKSGRLHVWPDGGVGEIRRPGLRIERCTGKTSNDNGLAVTAYSGATGKRNCLLPGDASYRYIPSVLAGERFSALCMSHHGGKLHSMHYPTAKSRSVAVNSAGPRNSYKHPLLSTVAAHLDAGWPIPATTGFSNQRPCHVLLPWGSRPYLFRGGCHGTGCSVIPAQTAPHAAEMVSVSLTPPPHKKSTSKVAAMTGLVLP